MEKVQRMNVAVTKVMKAQVVARAKEEYLTPSDIVRKALRRYLESNEKS